MGIEPNDASALPANDLQQTPQPSAAKSGAVTADAVLAMLAALPPAERARLATLLEDKARLDDAAGL
jgi:hypothetical protein